MEDINTNLNNDYLYKLLNHEEISREDYHQIKVAIYLTLLSLNNNSYQENDFQKEINIIEDYLRKINNLKVKIQLKRKPNEIDNLLNEIKEITTNNESIIKKYNKEKIDIISILDTKDPNEITTLVDKLTKTKIKLIEKIDNYNPVRNNIINNIHNTNYHIIDNTLYIGDNINIDLDSFYEIFSYLLDSNNYHPIFHNSDTNNSHKDIINNLIAVIYDNKQLDNEVIPVVLTALFTGKINDIEEINTSNFNIDNIKITDLYSFVNDSNNESIKTAKWKKIAIPNYYLYNKIKEITNQGMYYFKDNNFILEIPGDFKISITIPNMYIFLKDNLTNINKTKTKSKHI